MYGVSKDGPHEYVKLKGLFSTIIKYQVLQKAIFGLVKILIDNIKKIRPTN